MRIVFNNKKNSLNKNSSRCYELIFERHMIDAEEIFE